MDGYDAATYGDRIAPVYDRWWPADDPGAVDALADLAGGDGRVLELGVGTGQLAVPLTDKVSTVTGLDASAGMLERLAARPGGGTVKAVQADMAGPLPDGPFDVVVVARNTLFMLTEVADQRACFAAVADVLAPGGTFVVAAAVPEASGERSSVDVVRVEVDRVVLFVNRHDPETQQATGSFVEMTPEGNAFHPSAVRYSFPAELDSFAGDAGLRLAERWGGWDRRAFTDDSSYHVSLYGART